MRRGISRSRSVMLRRTPRTNGPCGVWRWMLAFGIPMRRPGHLNKCWAPASSFLSGALRRLTTFPTTGISVHAWGSRTTCSARAGLRWRRRSAIIRIGSFRHRRILPWTSRAVPAETGPTPIRTTDRTATCWIPRPTASAACGRTSTSERRMSRRATRPTHRAVSTNNSTAGRARCQSSMSWNRESPWTWATSGRGTVDFWRPTISS